VDVTQLRTVADLAGTAGDSVGPAGVPCVGDGTSGPRVQAIYAVATDRTDRYASLAGTIAGWAGQMDSALNASAAALSAKIE
jgi:hypothetical protein